MMGMQGQQGPAPDTPLPDTAEKVQISSLSLLKMIKHGTLECINLIFANKLRKVALEFQWRSWA